MKWYEKFRVGQRVRVVKKVMNWDYDLPMSWNSEGIMDKTVGRVYKILTVDRVLGYALDTRNDVGGMYWYPVESLEEENVKGRQLLFNFMKE